jgi:predicted AAA+ superfamily ATPase
MALGGFPEPLFRASQSHASRWSRLRLERLIQEDVRDLSNVSDLQSLKILAELLPERVGSLLSMNSLREDLGVAYGTVRNWMGLLEALYYCFLVRPFGGTLRRALTAEPKLYLFDGMPIKDEAKRRENLTALHLLKACQYWTDTAQGEFDLRFFRTKEKKEVDFVVLREGKPWLMLGCKSNSRTPSANLVQYAKVFKTTHNIQLVDGAAYHRDYAALRVSVQDYESFFTNWV